MADLSREQIEAKLKEYIDPFMEKDLITAQCVRNVMIEGDQVVVWSDAVPSPVAVRYAWHDTPTLTLYNAADLPASPFRTDSFKGVTEGKITP